MTGKPEHILKYKQAEACKDAIRVPGHNFGWCPHKTVRCNYLGIGDYALTISGRLERCHSPYAERLAKCTEPIVIDFRAARETREKAE